jgi:YbbR domain-containing protein
MRYLHYLLLPGLMLTTTIARAQENKEPATGQTPSATAKEQLTIYPVTADSYTNVYIEWEEMQPFTISIYDSKGILQHEWKEKSARSYQKAVDLSALPAGNYHIEVKGRKETLKKELIISRKEK